MTARLLIPAALRDCAGGSSELALEGATLRDVLEGLAGQQPVLAHRLRDERGELRPHILVFVDGVGVRGAAELDTPVRDGAEVYIAPAVSGG